MQRTYMFIRIKECIRKYSNNSNWNIGFVVTSKENFIESRSLPQIEWMKHPYKDRFFADPFIYRVTEEEIVIFVEEYIFSQPNGFISELIVDKKTKRLKQKYTLLKIDTHLSYPAIFNIDGSTFVYPENGSSGKLAMYKYDELIHTLIFDNIILNEALADATIVCINDRYYLIATKCPNTQTDAFLYESNYFNKEYKELGLVASEHKVSRPAGNFFEVRGEWYRPVQNCKKRYGAAIEIMKINDKDVYTETPLFSIKPQSFKYNLGIHTVNFYNDICVVDGYGYKYPIIGRLYNFLSKVKNSIVKG